MKETIKIAVEGMPGAGKTSSLTFLAGQLDQNTIFLPELNLYDGFVQAKNEDIWLVYHLMWQKRLKIIAKAAHPYSCLFDRTYFSNLAFTYALRKKNEYHVQKERIREDFAEYPFHRILILYTSSISGIKRRNLNQDYPSHPWDQVDFLKRLLEFYMEVLPKLSAGKIEYLNTESLSLNETQQKVLEILAKDISFKLIKQKVYSDEIKQRLNQFACKKNLGKPYTPILEVLGFPTLYFRQQAIQLDYQNNPLFLNNDRLEKILQQFPALIFP